MISKFVREQKRYTQNDLKEILECGVYETVTIIKRLKEYGVLRTVKATKSQKNLSDLVEEDIEITDTSVGDKGFFYVFTFVGIIIIQGRVLKCYPKYILDKTNPSGELKQIIKVLEQYNSKEQTIRMYNDNEDNEGQYFNLLAIILFLLNDYYENGVYTNNQDIIEVNGTGEILWDKTINEAFAIISNNCPYYIELKTQKRSIDDLDFFKRLHQCIISDCSKELQNANLIDLFGIVPTELSDEQIVDFGEKEYILFCIQKELDTQFNTRKQLLLKTMYAYIVCNNRLEDIDSFSLFGTNSFNLVWESVCSEVFNNQLQTRISQLELPCNLAVAYEKRKTDDLIDLIEKPVWYSENEQYSHQAKATLKPDLITIYKNLKDTYFIILDAKYFNLKFNKEELRGYPGVADVTKQYLYQLAYKGFIDAHKLKVRNAFLMPTSKNTIMSKATVRMNMLSQCNLQGIKIVLLPASDMYNHYLTRTPFDLSLLKLFL